MAGSGFINGKIQRGLFSWVISEHDSWFSVSISIKIVMPGALLTLRVSVLYGIIPLLRIDRWSRTDSIQKTLFVKSRRCKRYCSRDGAMHHVEIPQDHSSHLGCSSTKIQGACYCGHHDNPGKQISSVFNPVFFTQIIYQSPAEVSL